MPQDIADDRLPTPSVTTGGGAYRATATGGGDAWLCPHVHFTHQSARGCADEHVRKVAKALHAPSEPAA